jgi:FkbM family methyltransferase
VTSASNVSRDAIVVAMHNRGYERNEQEFMRLVVRPGMHAVDVGAHIGFHTAHLADLVDATGSVTAFEPLIEHARLLSGTIRARGSESRVRLVRAAAGEVRGTRTMVTEAPELAPANAYFQIAAGAVVGAHCPSTSSGHPNPVEGCVRPARDEGVTLRSVPVVTLDEAISNRPIGFLKIDAEGAEALVLRGARRLLAADRPIVLVDVHPHVMAYLDGTTPATLIREMARFGYECRLLGAGVPGSAVTDVHARGVTTVVFLPYVGPSFSLGSGDNDSPS